MRSLFIAAVAVLLAQAPANKSVLGTITSFNRDTKAIEVKPDNAAPVPVKLLANTVIQRIAPGETNLRSAVAIELSEVTIGDRVLVTLAANGADVLRIVVMAATDIAKRDDADRQDWNKRGISGIVSGKNGNQILLKIKTPRGDVQQTIAVSDKTKFRRYSPDSVKFADAKMSKADEVSVGDQIRARGEKSADGLRVDAEEVVSGTFLTKAGLVVSADAPGKEITVKELGSGKPFVIKVTTDSTIKQMPNVADGRGGARPGANVGQIVEALPAGKIEDIKAGTSVIVSSTKGTEAEK